MTEGRSRPLIAIAVALALTGGVTVYLDDRGPGGPFPLLGVALLVVGALAFGFLRRKRGGDESGFGIVGPTAPPTPADSPLPIGPRASRGLAIAVLLAAGTVSLYLTSGYSAFVLAGWLGSFALGTLALWGSRAPKADGSSLDRGERLFLGFVSLCVGVFVLPFLASMPVEISTDEIYSIQTARDFQEGTQTNALGLVSWWGLPALQFAALGAVGEVIGTSVQAMRLVSALTAIAVLVPFYLWVRSLNGPTVARIATVLLAAAHAFIGWGRIALTQNLALFILVLAFAALATGLRDRCPLRLLWGGIALGLGYHVYPSAQIGIVVWAGLLVWLTLLRSLAARDTARVLAVSGLGFALAAAPMVANMIFGWEMFTMRPGAVSLANPEAVALMGQSLGLPEPAAILRENFIRGLLSFNGAYPYVTYHNPGHGFLDPLTGSLLWLGLAGAMSRSRAPGPALAVIGFALIYVVGLLTEGAPVHGRLLVALPFVCVLAASALVWIGRAVLPSASERTLTVSGVATLAVVVGLNGWIYRDYTRAQHATGANDAMTAIARALDVGVRAPGPLERLRGETPRWDRGHLVVLVSGAGLPLFRWADGEAWVTWTAFFSARDRVRLVPDVASFVETAGADWDTATLFIRSVLRDATEEALRPLYPDVQFESIMPNDRVLAVHISP